MSSFTHPSWSENSMFIKKKSKPRLSGYGVSFNWPRPDGVTSGWYFGEGNVDPSRREMVTRSDPEYYAVLNTLPSTAGVPRWSSEMLFDRSKYTKKL